LPQQIEHLRGEHHIAILAALRLLDANNFLRAVDMLDLEPHHLSGAQAAAVTETEHRTSLEAVGNRQQPFRLIRAYHQWNLLRLAQVKDLGGKIEPAQRHPKQEPQPGHDAVAVADARARLGQVQLKQPDILERGGLRRSLEKCSKSFAAADVTSLCSRTEFARIHVLDHALTQRADSIRGHRQLLS
jgi:hypothetical protein